VADIIKKGGYLKMKKQNVIELFNAIKTQKDKGNIKFRYTLLKNESLIQSEINALTEIEKSINKIVEPINKERERLIKEIGTLDKTTNSYSIKQEDTEKITKFVKEFSEVQEKNKDLTIKFNKEYAEYRVMLQEPIKKAYKFLELTINECPDSLTTAELGVFMQCNIIK